MMLLAETHQFPGFFLGIILAWEAAHIYTVVELRKNFTFYPPRLIFCQVPMKSIDFITGKLGYFPF